MSSLICKRCGSRFLGEGDYCQACMRNPNIRILSPEKVKSSKRSKIEASPHLGDYLASYSMGSSFRDLERLAQSFGESISNDSFRLYFDKHPMPIEEQSVEVPVPFKPEPEVVGKLSYATSKGLYEKVQEIGLVSKQRLDKLLKG